MLTNEAVSQIRSDIGPLGEAAVKAAIRKEAKEQLAEADGKAAVITPEVNEVVVKSARNLPGVTTAPAKLINVYDLLNAKTLVIDKEALAVIEEVFA